MKVIFLDVDGPMKPTRCSWQLSVAAINRIHEKTGAVVVFNSTWGARGLEYMTKVAGREGITAPIYDVTDYPHLDDRLLAIKKWLRENPGVEAWCALDDVKINHPSAILVDYDIGISPDNYREATRILGNEDRFVVLI
jgi:hypothetical protein